ncbi:MAG: c-type cytochrome [Vicinamibacterales bacterium]
MDRQFTRGALRRAILAGSLLSMLVAAGGCDGDRSNVPPPAISAATAERVGLTPEERQEFYHLEEGSEVFPLDWFLALESETGSGLFAQNLERFGLIPDPPSPANPHGLPVGLTAGETRDLRLGGVKMLGLNCAACHVAELVHAGTRVRLDGAGGHTDVSAFYGALANTTVATVRDPARFLRFIDRLRDRAPNPLLTASDAERSARVFRATPNVDELGARSAFDKELRDELTTLVQQEIDRPAIDLADGIVIASGEHVEAATETLRARLHEHATPQAMASRVPSESSADSVLAKEASAAEIRRSLVPAFFRDALVTLRLLKARVAFLAQLAQRMDVEATVPGFGRVDAFGGARNILWGFDPRPTTAPVSYPHLWNFERLAWVHWDGNTTSVLERNMGQALGLGAVLDRTSMASTLSVVNLYRLEQLARKIAPPRWEDAFGPIDAAAADRGSELFERQCASCHVTRGNGEPLLKLEEIGTDPNRALNFAAPIGSTPNDRAIADLITRVKQRAYADKGLTPEQQKVLDGDRPIVWRVTSMYAARPLIAVWASAPYLHNNSVPTLHDLLLPASERPVTFFVGGREYDVERMGYVSTAGPGRFEFDTRKPGNRNSGHEYGTGLSDADRADLLAYLKRF